MILQKNTYLIVGLSLLVGAFSTFSAASNKHKEEHSNDSLLPVFQHTVSSSSIPINKTLNRTIRIALIYPSADISDFWVKNYQAMVNRLDELNISYIADEYSSRQIEHSLQSKYVEQVINKHITYDFVIFGPSELNIQADNIQKLSAKTEFKTFIWAFHTPNADWEFTQIGRAHV